MSIFSLMIITIFSYFNYCMILLDFNFAINLNLILFAVFKGFTEFCILRTERSHKITISVVDYHNHMVYVLYHILPCAPSES